MLTCRIGFATVSRVPSRPLPKSSSYLSSWHGPFEGNLSIKLGFLRPFQLELSLRQTRLLPGQRSQSKEHVYDSSQSRNDSRFRPVFSGAHLGVCLATESFCEAH